MSDVLIGRTEEIEQSLRRLRDGRGLRLVGDAGSGKTRLLRALCERLARRGDRVIETVASPATRAVPLGPLLSLLPTEPSEDLGSLIRSICAELAAAADGARLVVSIDDVHHLDEPSVALLSHLLTESDCHLMCTVRSGESLPGGLAELWSTFGIDDVTIEPLTVGDVAALAEQVLGGPVAPSLGEALAERSAGNPLLVRELLLDARDADQLSDGTAGWEALVPLDPGRRTVDVVRRRVSRLPDEVVDTLELIALADQIRLRLLPKDWAAAIDELEDQALVRVERPATGDPWHVRVDHPLVGESLVAALPVRRRVLHLRRLVGLVTDAGCPEPGDASKVVDWLEAAGDPVGAPDCLRAAREALAAFDLDRAERWALRAGDGAATAHDVQRALGEILRLRGDLEGAAAALALAEERAQNDIDVASVAVDRSALLAFQLGRAEDAISVLEDAAERVKDPMRAIALRSEAALIGTLLGRFDDVLTVASSIDDLSLADDEVQWSILENEVYARVMLARLDGVDDVIERSLPFSFSVAGERPHERDLLIGLRGGARLQAGELHRGVRELQGHLVAARGSGDYRAIAASVMGQLMLITCDDEIGAVTEEAIGQHEWLDPFGALPIAIGVGAIAAAQCGDPDGADAVLARAEGEPAAEPWASIWFGRARGAIAAARGDVERAIDEYVAAGTVALDTSHNAYAVVTYHDALEHGAAELVAAPIQAAIDRTRDAHLLARLGDHAAAVASGSVEELSRCAAWFESVGAVRYAATAHRDRATLLLDAGDVIAATVADAAAQIAGWSLGPFLPPTAAPIPDALSPRELEVAVVAAAGAPSKVIGEELFLATRTVDNHLRNVYAKLGLAGRQELATVPELVDGRDARRRHR